LVELWLRCRAGLACAVLTTQTNTNGQPEIDPALVRAARRPDRRGGCPQLAADIRDVLARLTPEHRAVLVLRDLEGLDEQAAGALLDVPVGTVRSRLFRARRSFRKAWSP
jgi:RNA polymerase sigma factor (sigma-70 family)